MLMIRLARIGKKKQPQYRLVVSEKARDMYGKALDTVGNYNPRSKAATLNQERITHWMGNGAQLSATVHNLLVTNGVIEDKKRNTSNINKKKQAKFADKKRTAEEAAEAAKAKEAEAKAAAETEAKEKAAAEAEAATAPAEASEEAAAEPATEEKAAEPADEADTSEEKKPAA